MTNAKNILDALRRIGANEKARSKILEALEAIEKDLFEINLDVRRDIITPIIDSLYVNAEPLQRTLNNGIIINFPYSSKIAREFIMSSSAYPDHVWEPQTTKLLLELARKSQNGLIGGAYWGDQAILVAHAMKNVGNVHCFELNESNLCFLRKNVAENNLSNIHLINKALWDIDNIHVNLFGEDSLETCKEASDNALDTYATITIDAYGKNKGIPSFDFIMLDIEGGESKALKGAEFYLSMPQDKAPHLIFEIHKNYVDWTNGIENVDIIKFLSKFGYIFFAIRDYHSNVSMAGRPIELVPINDIYLEGPPHGFNIFAIKNHSIIENSIFSITPGVSPKLLDHKDPALHAPLAKS